MKECILEINHLSKSYGGAFALKDISVRLEPGKIYGLIGRNGAGKSTLMRAVAGLTIPTEGEVKLFGKQGVKNLEEERKRIGCMIEYPSLEPKLSAKANMKFHRILKGIPNEELEDELLEVVGLKDTGKKKAKDFSLGMKQRLGIAIALLGNPEFLILDEPINGLDPLGVVEIRKLLLRLCEEKHLTILISSHNLPELYQVATDYIIIHEGELKQTLNHDELETCCSRHILLESDHVSELCEVIETKLQTTKYKVMPNNQIKLYDYVEDKRKVAGIVYESGILLTNFSIEGDTLENYFISVIGGEKNA